MLNLGTRFWPPGPPSVDWTIDLSDGSFGPLRPGSTSEELKTALGQPDNTQFWGDQLYFYYERFALHVTLDIAGRIDSFELEIPERVDAEFGDDETAETPAASPFDTGSPRFDPRIKLPGMAAQRLRRLRLEECERAFNAARHIKGEGEGEGDEFTREWTRRDLTVYVDLMEDGATICNLGWMLPEDTEP